MTKRELSKLKNKLAKVQRYADILSGKLNRTTDNDEACDLRAELECIENEESDLKSQVEDAEEEIEFEKILKEK